MAAKSTPAGSVPKVCPQSPPSRLAQKASATSAGACRTSSDPCTTSAIRSTTRRARASAPAGEHPLQPGDRLVEPPVGARRRVRLGQQRNQTVRLPAQRPQHVEGLHVAGALPDRVERRVPVEPRQAGLLDVPVAAQALQGLADHGRLPLAHPELAGRHREPLERLLAPVDRAGQPQRQQRRRLRLDRQVGQHVPHGRLVGEHPAERAAVTGVVDRLPERGPHAGRRADHAVQPGHRHHLDDRPDALALGPDQPGHRVVELGLAARVAAVAQLVLEALDAEDVTGAVRQHPGHEETGEAGRGLRQHQEQVAHRRAGEPLVPAQPPGAVAGVGGGGRVGPHVRSALLLGHPHAGEQSALGGRGAQARVVLPGGQQRLVERAQPGVVAQRRHHRVGHRNRTGMPRLDLRPDEQPGRPGHVCSGPVVGPRRSGQAFPDGDPHQLVPGRVELDLVDPVPEPVVGAQPRLVPVGVGGPLLRLGGAGELPEPVQVTDGPRRTLPRDPGEQRGIGGDVVVDQGRRLVENLMGHPPESTRG
jgi:hypothetical protein